MFQANTGQTVPTDSNQSLTFLVIAGILIIFVCLVAMFLPHIKVFITKPQEFNSKMLGIRMRVSILTVFVMMGFILSLSSFALQWQGYAKHAKDSEQKIAELNGTIKQLQDQVRQKDEDERNARTFNMSILLKPKMGKEEVLNRDDWSCDYWIDQSGQPSGPVHANIDRARNGQFLKVFLSNITPETRLYRVDLKKGNQTWAVEGINPLTDGTWDAEPQGGVIHEN